MDINDLIYFKKVAELQHMTKAAEDLHISQSCLSKSIKRLETSLGKKLFDRTTKKLILNTYGQILLTHTNKILAEFNQMMISFNDLNKRPKKSIKFGSENYLLSMKWMTTFTEQFKDHKITHHTFNSSNLTNKLFAKDIDLALTLNPISDPRIENIVFDRDQLCLIVGKNHPLSGKSIISTQEVNNLKFLALPKNNDLLRLIDYLAINGNFIPNVIFEAESYFYPVIIDHLNAATLVLKSQITSQDSEFPYHPIAFTEDFTRINISINYLKERNQETDFQEILNFFRNINREISLL